MRFNRSTYAHQVHAYIVGLIRDGELPAGASVKESLVAERLGISRAPVREALQELLHKGLLTSEPQKGKAVRSLTPQEIVDSYAVGGVLEAVGVSESLPRWSQNDLEALHAMVERLRERCGTSACKGFFPEFDDSFHASLLQHCENRRLVEMARISCASISKVLLYRQWLEAFTLEEFCERHTAIAAAMASRDAPAVARVLREHYLEVGRRLVAVCPGAQAQAR